VYYCGDLAGMGNALGVALSFILEGSSHSHFKYAFDKESDKFRKQLTEDLKKKGVQ